MSRSKRFVSGIGFKSSSDWEQRYTDGRDSGSGSEGRLAEYEAHVLHRKSTDYIASTIENWSLHEHLKNKYAFDSGDSQTTSHADFFVYGKA